MYIAKGKIIRSNNGLVITPYNKQQARQLERKCSIWDPVYHEYIEVTGFKMSYEGVDSFVTHSWDIKWIQHMFPEYTIIDRPIIDDCPIDVSFEFNDDVEMRDLQTPIIDEVKSNRQYNREIFINLPTGFGKTLMTIYLASIIKTKTVIMCFSTEILAQWIKTIATKTTYDITRIKIISGKFLDIVLKESFDPYEYDIYICTPGILTGYGKKHGNELVDTLFRRMGIGLLVFDEAHRNVANLVKLNALTNVKLSLYLSADYGQGKQELEDKYYQIFKKTYVIKPSEEILEEMKYTTAIICEYNTYPTEIEKNSVFTNYGYSSQLFLKYQINNGKIYIVIDSILDFIEKDNEKGYRTLILLGMIAHTEMVAAHISKRFPDKIVNYYHSNISRDEKNFILEKSEIIVSTYQSFSTGMDIIDPPIKYIICCDNANKIVDSQSSGRARPLPDGSAAYYFMLIDAGFAYCKKKLLERLKYLTVMKIREIRRVYFKT